MNQSAIKVPPTPWQHVQVEQLKEHTGEQGSGALTRVLHILPSPPRLFDPNSKHWPLVHAGCRCPEAWLFLNLPNPELPRGLCIGCALCPELWLVPRFNPHLCLSVVTLERPSLATLCKKSTCPRTTRKFLTLIYFFSNEPDGFFSLFMCLLAVSSSHSQSSASSRRVGHILVLFCAVSLLEPGPSQKVRDNRYQMKLLNERMEQGGVGWIGEDPEYQRWVRTCRDPVCAGVMVVGIEAGKAGEGEGILRAL